MVIIHSLFHINRQQFLGKKNLRTRTLEVMVYHLYSVYFVFAEEFLKFFTYLDAVTSIRFVCKTIEIASSIQSQFINFLAYFSAYRIDDDFYTSLFITVNSLLHHLQNIGIKSTTKA